MDGVKRPATFHVCLIKPSKYDDEGFVIRHWRGVLPNNTLACLHGLTEDIRRRELLGNVDLRVRLLDEAVMPIPIEEIASLSRSPGQQVVAALVGVQTNQFCRAADIAFALRREEVPVIIGGFHVSGMMAMFAEVSPEIRQLLAAGATVVAGEVEHRWSEILRDALEGNREVELSPDQKADLLSFVHDDGKGFVAAHIATTAFLSWPEFGEMLGGRFDSHPWGSVTANVINEDPSFPATRHLPLTFELHDEFYQTKDFSREKSRVLLRLDTSKLPVNQNVHITNGDFPLAWAKMYGKGRVFYASFAHDAKTWDDPDIYQMYFEAIKWALKLTDADVTPRPFPVATPPDAK